MFERYPAKSLLRVKPRNLEMQIVQYLEPQIKVDRSSSFDCSCLFFDRLIARKLRNDKSACITVWSRLDSILTLLMRKPNWCKRTNINLRIYIFIKQCRISDDGLKHQRIFSVYRCTRLFTLNCNSIATCASVAHFPFKRENFLCVLFKQFASLKLCEVFFADSLEVCLFRFEKIFLADLRDKIRLLKLHAIFRSALPAIDFYYLRNPHCFMTSLSRHVLACYIEISSVPDICHLRL